MIEHITIAFVIGFGGVIGIENGVGKSSRIANNRYGPIPHGDHLSQPARFKGTGNQDHVGTCVNEMSQFLIVGYFQVTVRVVVEVALQLPELMIDFGVGA